MELFMKWEKTRCAAARRATCEIHDAQRMRSQAKANRTLWPSSPGTWAPGFQPSKQAHPSTEHRSKAWVQGPHQACFLASLRTTAGPTLGPGEREKLPHVPLASQWGHIPVPSFTSIKLGNLNPSLFFSGRWISSSKNEGWLPPQPQDTVQL